MKGLFLILLVAGLALRAAQANEAGLVPPRSGAIKVAQAGLLNGRAATTHHDYLDKFAQEFPTVRVVHSARYVRSDPLIYTAGGLTSGVDLALHVVDSYFGRTVAQKTADYMEYQSEGWKTP